MDFETHTALMELPKRYDDAINRQDAAAYGELFTSDAVWDAGQFFVATGRDDVVDRFNWSYSIIDWVVRMPMSTLILECDGQRARLRTYLYELIKLKAGPEDEADRPKLGVYTYVDDCVKEPDGRWRIRLHKLHIILFGDADLQNISVLGFPVPSP